MINFLKGAPAGLKTFDELFRYATNLYKQTKGVFPEGIDKISIQRQAANLAEERGKVIDLPTSNIKNLEKTGPTVDLSKYTNEDLNKLVKEGDELQADLSLMDEEGASTLPYREFQEKSARLKEINNIIRAAQESKLPDSYFDRPRGEGGIPTTIEGKTKNMSAEEIMDFLMNKGKGKDTNIGTAPKTTKTKPKVDPELQAMDDQSEMFKDFSTRNLTGIEAMKEASSLIGRKGKYKNISDSDAKTKLGELQEIINKANAEPDLGTKLKDFDGDPDAMAQGGRIGFSEGSRREFDPSNFIEKMTQDMIKKSPDGIVMDPTNPVEDLTREPFTADRPTKPKIKAEPFDPYGPNAPFYFNQDTPELSQTLVYDDGTIYYKDTGEYYNKDGVQVPGPSKNAKPVPKTLEAASGGRIGFSGGGAGFAGDPMEGDQYTMGQQIPGSPQVSMGEFGPVNVGIFGGGGYSKNEIVPGVNQATTNQNYGIAGQLPIGDTGFTIGGDYMKSRANDRFTGDAIPGQTFKSVPTDSDRFNVGINFRKQFKDGSKPPSKSRRNFLKLMAGLGSLPFVGPLFKGAKTVEKAATAVETVPPYFFQLVNKIKQFGTDITSPGVTTESRQRVTQYEIDGDDYVMTENLSTGKIEIEKEKMGGAQFYDEYGEMDVADGIVSKEYLTYKPKEVDVDPKTGKKIEYPEEYEEFTATPSGDDGTDMATESGLNYDTVKQIVKETGNLKGVKQYYPDVELTTREILDKRIQEIVKQRNKKAGGGVAYMLGE